MQLYNVLKARQVITQKANLEGLRFATARKFQKFIKLTDDDEKFFVDKRAELIAKYAKVDENGEFIVENGNYTFTDENFAEFSKQFNELNQIEVEIPDTVKVDESELEKISFTIEEVSIIDFLVKE